MSFTKNLPYLKLLLLVTPLPWFDKLTVTGHPEPVEGPPLLILLLGKGRIGGI
jgi:hypothetical protein